MITPANMEYMRQVRAAAVQVFMEEHHRRMRDDPEYRKSEEERWAKYIEETHGR